MAMAGGPPQLKDEDPFTFEATRSAAMAYLAVYNGSSPHHLTSHIYVFAGDSAVSGSSEGAAAEGDRD